MDPVSQFAWGATLAAGARVPRSKECRVALLTGGFAGLLADLDVFIRSSSDPLLQIEFHRHFTHSLIFIPIGALIAYVFVKVILLLCRSQCSSNSQLFLYAFLGYGSHGFLDACTSYGTQLFWPFSSTRVAWSVIGIVDPFFTATILALLVFAFIKQKASIARFALIYGLTYLLFGLYQRDRAENLALVDVESRGEILLDDGCQAKPSPLSLFLWRTICLTKDDRFLVDAWHISPLKSVKYSGGAIDRFKISRDAPWIDQSQRQARDLERFEWFSSGYIAWHPSYPNLVADIRYSLIPNRLEPLWGIELDRYNQSEDRPTPWRSFRAIKKGDWETFLNMHLGL